MSEVSSRGNYTTETNGGNWHDTGERPADLPPDVGTYITDNELVGIILLLWLIIAPILSCAISYPVSLPFVPQITG
ncbi:MAG: hypothetical protein MR298_07915 [Odoribacter sp.]|nr:hypothetical protein [Odoribacter sp.]MDY3032641.1 hypothetical protein [Odoribacter sp.]